MQKEVRCCGCKSVWRRGMQKEEALLRVQGGFPAVCRQCPGIMRTRGKFLHVIARSEATWQSVLLAAVQNKKQYFGRIRKSAYEFARSSTKLSGFSAGMRIAAPVPCNRRGVAVFSMSLRGAKRRGNPYSLRQCKTRSNTLGEYGKVHTNLPEVVPSYQASLRGRGLPQVCTLVRNDMQKHAA